MNNMKNQQEERKKYSKLVVQSSDRKKIIAAGPGTGKTYIFRELLKTKNKNAIALTFINNLAFQLQKDLEELAKAYTFHSYCKKLLHHVPVGGIKTDFTFFPQLGVVVESDGKIFSFDGHDFKSALQNMIEDDGRVDFYLSRGNFYNAVGYDDSVYRVLKYFDSHPDKIPVFEQIVVDEYQDFNKLEVKFIEKLEKYSPILIVGDDDQAIYDFKNASPSFIREKVRTPGFRRFELPFSSRCTQVVVDAVDDVVVRAQKLGRLQNRIPKRFVCYEPDKSKENRLYQHIEHVQCSVHQRRAPYISRYIEEEIREIPKEVTTEIIQTTEETREPGVLIIGPSHYLDLIYEYLRDRFNNIIYQKRGRDLNLLDGYKILLKDKNSNLGWRIVLEFSDIQEKNEIIRIADKEIPIVDQLSEEFVYEHSQIIDILTNIKDGKQVSSTEKEKLEELIGSEHELLNRELNRGFEENEQKVLEEEEIKIQLTTFNGCKGLSAAFVFVVGFNNGEFPRDPRNPTDNEVCQFIVSLTRTRKKCYLISNYRFGGKAGIQPSLFLKWINHSRIQCKKVTKAYFV